MVKSYKDMGTGQVVSIGNGGLGAATERARAYAQAQREEGRIAVEMLPRNYLGKALKFKCSTCGQEFKIRGCKDASKYDALFGTIRTHGMTHVNNGQGCEITPA